MVGGNFGFELVSLDYPDAQDPHWVLCTTTVIPAKAGIQRGRATASKAKRLVQTRFYSLWGIKGEGCAQNPIWIHARMPAKLMKVKFGSPQIPPKSE